MRNIIFVWYLFVILLLAFAPSTSNFYAVVISSAFLLSTVFVFFLGTASFQQNINIRHESYNSNKASLGWSLVLLPMLFIPTLFYSGLTMPGLIEVFSSGGYGLYSAYQTYAFDNNLSSFSSEQIPYLLMSVAAKLIIVLMAINYLKFGERSRKIALEFYFSLIALCLSGFLRGTSIETFEAVLLLVFAKDFFRKAEIKSAFFQISLLFVIILSLFIYNLELRGAAELDCVSKEYCYSNDGGLFSNTLIGFPLYQVSGYFSFGIHSVSLALLNDGFDKGIHFFIPEFYGSDAAKSFIRTAGVDLGAAWVPDIFILASSFGVFICIFIVFLIGVFSARLDKDLSLGRVNFVNCALLYYMFIQMISFSFGNILTSSVPTVLVILILISIKVLRFVIIRR